MTASPDDPAIAGGSAIGGAAGAEAWRPASGRGGMCTIAKIPTAHVPRRRPGAAFDTRGSAVILARPSGFRRGSERSVTGNRGTTTIGETPPK